MLTNTHPVLKEGWDKCMAKKGVYKGVVKNVTLSRRLHPTWDLLEGWATRSMHLRTFIGILFWSCLFSNGTYGGVDCVSFSSTTKWLVQRLLGYFQSWSPGPCQPSKCSSDSQQCLKKRERDNGINSHPPSAICLVQLNQLCFPYFIPHNTFILNEFSFRKTEEQGQWSSPRSNSFLQPGAFCIGLKFSESLFFTARNSGSWSPSIPTGYQFGKGT